LSRATAPTLLSVAVCFVLFALLLLARRPSSQQGGLARCRLWAHLLLTTALFAEACLLMQSARLLYVNDLRWIPVFWWLRAALLGVSGCACITALVGARLPQRYALTPLVVAGVVLFLLRVLTLVISPHPRIDVWVNGNHGVDTLLAGGNPYTAAYPDIYRGRYGYAPAFSYGPAYLYWVTPFRAWLGDVRYGTIAADLVTAALLLAIGRKGRLDPRVSWTAAMVWLANPVSLFVLEQAWIDPILIVGAAGVTVAALHERWRLVGALLGFVSCAKQYGVLVVAFALVWILRHYRRMILRVGTMLAAAVLVLFGPFVWLDAGAFLRSTILAYIDFAPRRDAFSLTSWLLVTYGVQLPQGLLLGLYGTAAGTAALWLWLARRPDLRDWAVILPIVYGFVFLLGKVAFCNYYYFVSFLVMNYVLLEAAGAVVPVSSRDPEGCSLDGSLVT
jgi:hypothetical protein